jgi:hypothetical protein
MLNHEVQKYILLLIFILAFGILISCSEKKVVNNPKKVYKDGIICLYNLSGVCVEVNCWHHRAEQTKWNLLNFGPSDSIEPGCVINFIDGDWGNWTDTLRGGDWLDMRIKGYKYVINGYPREIILFQDCLMPTVDGDMDVLINYGYHDIRRR